MKDNAKSVRALVATLVTIGSLAGGVNGAVSVTSLGGTQYLADIGTIAFSVTTSGTAQTVTVDNFYVGPNTDISSNPILSNISYSLNGGADVALTLSTSSGSYGGGWCRHAPNPAAAEQADPPFTAGSH